jgi:hypothetical protein
MIPLYSVFFMFTVFSVSLCLVLAAAVPLVGGIVRYRANYNPKSVQLEEEEGVPESSTGPIIPGLLAMFKRVYSLEGFPGFYKGYMPTLLISVIASVISLILGLSKHPLPQPIRGSFYLGLFANLGYTVLLLLLTLPFSIIINRAITTPKVLPWFDPKLSLRVLLTPAERRRPWLLYLTPGLLASQIALAAYLALVLRNFRHLLLPNVVPGGIPNSWDLPALRTVAFLMIVILSTFILTPLDVISTRLLVQRNNGGVELNTGEDENASVPEYPGGEDVIALRTEQEPYAGLIDCAKKIMEEEGKEVLYRLWWLSLLGGFAGALA